MSAISTAIETPARPHLVTTVCERRAVGVAIKPHYGSGTTRAHVEYLHFGATDGPVIVVQGGISADRDVCRHPETADAGWWDAMVGPGCAIDTNACAIVSINWLDGNQLGASEISSNDQANAIAGVLEVLGIKQVDAFVGASYGAMVALAFAASHARKCRRVLALCGAHKPHPRASAQRAIQRAILRLGQQHGCAQQATSLARQLALTTYRGPEALAARFAGKARLHNGHWQRPIESWLEHNGARFAGCHDAQRYLELSQSIDLHEIDPRGILTPVHLIGVDSDALVPLADLCELQRALPASASLDVIHSPHGHDGFLLEADKISPILRDILDCTPGCTSHCSLPTC